MRFEDERHEGGKDDGRRNTRTRRRERASERLKNALLCPLHRAVCKQISKARNGHGRARARPFYEGLVQPERRQRNARQHEDDEDLPRREVGEIDDELRNCTDEPAYGKRLYKHQQNVNVFHICNRFADARSLCAGRQTFRRKQGGHPMFVPAECSSSFLWERRLKFSPLQDDGMCDAGDALPLSRRDGREQRARRHEQNSAQRTGEHLAV